MQNKKFNRHKNIKNIEDRAIQYVVNYLKKREKIKDNDIKKQKLKGADIKILKNGKCIKWIEVKGCNKKETNIRITPQSLFTVAEDGGLNKYLIQPSKIKDEALVYDFEL